MNKHRKNLSYKQKLFFYFVIIFAVFTGGILLFEQSREHEFKTGALTEKLDAYAGIVNTALVRAGNYSAVIDSLSADFPPNIRLTLIDERGHVFYDNVLADSLQPENHAGRPEIRGARKNGTGTFIRTSASTNQAYLYYAKHFNNYYVRVALPYNIQVKNFLRPGNGFIYFVLCLFILILLVVYYVTGRFGKFIADNYQPMKESKWAIALEQEKTRLLKQEITGNIAHELRTPVTGIRGYLETVLEQPLTTDKQRYFIQKAYGQTLALSELIRDMSLITKIEGAPQSFAVEPVPMAALVEEVCTGLEPALQEKQITINYKIPADVVVRGNRHLLYAIFRNLTENAICYAGTGISVMINKYNEDDNVYYFSYADTGVGIPDEHFPRLFERFYRVNEGRTRDTGGSGLGLSIVKNAVLFHKGAITARNRDGGGLEILFTLPK